MGPINVQFLLELKGIPVDVVSLLRTGLGRVCVATSVSQSQPV